MAKPDRTTEEVEALESFIRRPQYRYGDKWVNGSFEGWNGG